MNAANPMPAPAQEAARLAEIFAQQRSSFLDDMPVSLERRHDRLDRGIAMLLAHRERLLDAVMHDFPSRPREWALMAEIFSTLNAWTGARKQVARWMKPERRKAPPPFNLFGARAEIQYQPLGVVGIMGAWNGVLNLVLVPLAMAIAAGNRGMLCPSDLMPASGQALDEAVRTWFDPAEVAVAFGGLETSKAFARLPFDHLIFTGSPAVGAKVYEAAAPNLTPVTLELGGKCPVIVADDADIADTARRLIAMKTLNGGQACIGADLLFVPRRRLDALVTALDTEMERLYPGSITNPAYCGLVNDRHYRRLETLVDEARAQGARVVPLGTQAQPGAIRDPQTHRLALQLVIEPPAGTRALAEELFGPVLVACPYDDADEVCARLRRMPKPLALYVFSKDAGFAQRVLDRSFSGGVTLNDTLFHYSVPDLPFGGVGRSGIGAYSAGIDGFRRFSHARSVYRQAGPIALSRVMQPPYGKLYDFVVRKQLERLARRYGV